MKKRICGIIMMIGGIVLLAFTLFQAYITTSQTMLNYLILNNETIGIFLALGIALVLTPMKTNML